MRGILFDLDGVLYNSEEQIEGAARTVRWVNENGIPYLYVTNTTSRGRSVLIEKLRRFGIPAKRDQIMTPCVTAAEWMKIHGDGRVALFVSPKAIEEFEGLALLPEDSEAGAAYVVIGDLGDAWDYRTLNRAFRILLSDPESVLVALGMTRYWHAQDGLRLDVAPFVAALEHATGRKALVFGKPEATFFRAAAEKLKLSASEIVMVGDSIETDIAAAQQSGMKGILVRTGKFRPSDLEGETIPDAVLDSIRDLPDWWTGV
ncbi:MAG: TIGR01458 family HAD-type hydrolase [Acidobacteria bacterium]|nr:TIGR01458 family HAD-type hydrolase [Acidobacteriota bacterium]